MMASTTVGLSVGRIPFLVCSPFFYNDLQASCAGIFFQDGPPSQQNQALFEGKIQLAPSSSVAYARHPELFWIIPEICTGSTLEIRSVKLFSLRPLSELDGQPIHLTSQSGTSVQLMRLLAENYVGIHPRWIEGPWGSHPCTARLLIGDQALAEEEFGAWPYRYDLATLWQKWQGLPFVFGMWIVHASALEQGTLLEQYRQHLMDSVKSFRAEPESALETWVRRYPTRIPMDTLLDYFGIIDYRFTDAHKESLARFYSLCQEAGIIERAPALRFLDPLAP